MTRDDVPQAVPQAPPGGISPDSISPDSISPDSIPSNGISPEESRYLDGELSAEETRSMERRLTANPAQAARLDAWRDAMGLWRDDTLRAGSLDPDALVERILSDSGARSRIAGPRSAGRGTVSLYAGRWYVAAAALLMSIGIGGTLLAHSAGADASGAGRSETRLGARIGHPHVAGFEFGLLDKMAEAPEFAPDLVIARADAQNNHTQNNHTQSRDAQDHAEGR